MTGAPGLDEESADRRARADEIAERVAGAEGREDAAAALADILTDASALQALRNLRVEDAGAWAAVLARLRTVKGLAADVRSLKKLVETTAPVRLVRDGEEDDFSPDFVPEGYEIPRGWKMTRLGVWQIRQDQTGEKVERVTMAPIFVVGRLIDVDSGQHALELAWPAWRRGWARHVAQASVVAESRGIVALAALGAPITSANAGRVVEYIDACRAANERAMPVGLTAQRMGWMEDGFLLGDTWIGQDERRVCWRGDDGQDQLAAAYEQRGTWTGWLDVTRSMGASPAAWLVVYAAVASVLVEYVGAADGGTLDISGETTGGKTTILRLAASVAGDPARIVRSWKTSMAGIEGYCATLRNLAPCLDDTKKARNREMVADVLYMQSGGMGQMRGKPGAAGQGVGMRRAETWRSMMISTGEERATSFTQDAGARARTLCVVGDPLEGREQADRIAATTAEHHGHLLPRVIRWLLEDGRRAKVSKDYAETRAERAARLGQSGAVAGRLGDIVTLLECARYVCRSVGLPDPPSGCDPIGYAERCAVSGGQDSDRPSDALLAVYSWCVARQTHFWGRHIEEGGLKVPSQGWAGAWADDGAAARWSYIGLTSASLEKALVEAGYTTSAVSGIVERWAERGWLEMGGSGYKKRARIQGIPTWVYAIRREVVAPDDDEVIR